MGVSKDAHPQKSKAEKIKNGLSFQNNKKNCKTNTGITFMYFDKHAFVYEIKYHIKKKQEFCYDK